MSEFYCLNKVIWKGSEMPAMADIGIIVKDYMGSRALKYIEYVSSYYDSKNADLMAVHRDKAIKRKTPNWFVPTAYYSTLVDSLSGYMFNNVIYSAEKAEGEELADLINTEFRRINIDVKDMATGTRAIAFNKGCEIVYTTGDGNSEPTINVLDVDPRQMIFVYDNSVESNLIMGIRVVDAHENGKKYYIDAITKDSWASYVIDDKDNIRVNESGKNDRLFWDECPCIEYKTEVLNGQTSFHAIIPYIAALDAVVTGNSNELDKLADAILAMTKLLSDEEKKRLGDIKLIEGMDKGDIVQYVQRQIDPSFRQMLLDFLVREIHKHSHVVDWYSSDNGAQGDASGRALRVRATDMEMNASRIEKNVKLGWYKRIRLFKQFFVKNYAYKPVEGDDIKISMNRTRIVGVEDVAPLLVGVDFMSNQTKQELSGLDPQKEEERKEAEKETSTDITDIIQPATRTITDATIDELDMPQE